MRDFLMFKFFFGQISGLVFEVIRQEMPLKKSKSHHSIGLAPLADFTKKDDIEGDGVTEKRNNADVSGLNMKPLKKRSMVSVDREKFLDVVCNALAKYQYLGPKQRADLMIACRYILLPAYFYLDTALFI